MQLANRHRVGRTDPTITIGKRVWKDRKQGRSRIARGWTAEWCIGGRQGVKSLRTRDRSAALSLARQLAVGIKTGSGIKPLDPPTLKEIVDAFYQLQCARNRAPKTLEKYDLVCRRFLHWAGERRQKPAELFREPDLLAFDAAMRAEGLGDKTRYDRLILVKQFFNQAVRSGLIGKSPVYGVSFTIPAWSLQPCFEPEQVWKLLEAAAPPLRLVWGLMAYAGLRFGEVRDLRWGDLLLTRGKHGYICVSRGGSGSTTKSKRNRLIPIHPSLRKMIDGHEKIGERVVYGIQLPTTRNKTKPLVERPLLLRLKAECNRLKFENADSFKLHTFRHAFASMCARANVSFKFALAWMGHQRSEVLDLYFRMFDSAADAAMETICYEPAERAAMDDSPEYEI